MRTFKVDLNQRLKTAAEAKEAALKKFTERKADDDPAVLARKAARLEAAKAREARAAERKAKKLEEGRVIVEGRNVAKKHSRPSRKRPAMRATLLARRSNSAGTASRTVHDRRVAARLPCVCVRGVG